MQQQIILKEESGNGKKVHLISAETAEAVLQVGWLGRARVCRLELCTTALPLAHHRQKFILSAHAQRGWFVWMLKSKFLCSTNDKAYI